MAQLALGPRTGQMPSKERVFRYQEFFGKDASQEGFQIPRPLQD
jgi:hypothetical protein